jgi:hypothetical protein
MFLIPGTAHRVTWTKQNLLDTAEYYPRAIIRDQRSNTILATLDLANEGDDIRYSHMWDVVQDPTGQGRQIEVEITVYDDSGHATPSGVYGRWSQGFTILDISRMSRGGGSIGGNIDGIDYGRVAEILGEQLTKMLPGLMEKFKPEIPDLAELVQSVDGVKESIWERLRKVLTLAKKAESAEEAAQHIREGVAALKEAGTSISKEIQGAREEMRGLVSDAKEEIAAAAEEATSSVVEAFEESATRSADVLKKNVEAAGDTMAKKVGESIQETLKKPIKIQAVQEYSLAREEDKKEETQEDKRVGRFMS